MKNKKPLENTEPEKRTEPKKVKERSITELTKFDAWKTP